MGHSGNTPSGYTTIDFSYLITILVVFVILLIIAIIITIIIFHFKLAKTEDELKKFKDLQNPQITTNELNLLTDFRKLNEERQKVILEITKNKPTQE